MLAEVYVSDSAVTEKYILDYLAANNVVFGIDQEAVKDIIRNRRFNTFVRVAEGRMPVKGEDTRFVLHFKNELAAESPKSRADGSVDHRDLNYVTPVYAGDTIVDILPPVEGENGRDVLGNDVPTEPGKEIRLHLGVNVEFTNDKRHIIATESGYAQFDNNTIRVLDVLEIGQSIDYSVGNITFPGKVVIKGSVMDGFAVKAKGDIIVHQDVVNSVVESEGSVIIRGVMNNRLSGHVKAEKNVTAGIVNFGKVTACETLSVEKEMLYSQVSATKEIRVDGKDSRIMGGTITCNGTICARDIGSRAEASKTRLFFASDQAGLRRLDTIIEILKENTEELEKINAEMKSIESYLSSPGISPAEFHEFEKIYDDFLQKKSNMEQRNRELEREQEAIMLSQESMGDPLLLVNGCMYPGVVLQFHGRSMSVTEEKRRIKAFFEDNTIKIENL